MDREAMALNDISKSLKETNRLLKSIAISLDRLEKKTLMSWTCTDEAGEIHESAGSTDSTED